MREFTKNSREAILKLLIQRKIMSEEEADTFTHALLDIHESVTEIYDDFLPQLLNVFERSSADLYDIFAEIREACRHIGYHLHDAKLPPGN